MEGTENFNQFIVGNLPTLMYVPDFITNTEETELLNNIYGAPLSKWKSLKSRRLQNWGGIVHEKGLLPQDLPPWLTKITQRINEKSGLFPSAINHILINEYLPNQGIMPHQDGPAYFPVVAILSLGSPVVMEFTPHSKLKKDVDEQTSNGEAFVTETNEWKENHHPFSILLMPCSLLIFKDNAYSDYLHGIKDNHMHQYDGVINETEALTHLGMDSSEKAVEVTRSGDTKVIHRTSTRISLTCRLVFKVHKKLFKF
ncbi:alpha-ketoglutarate-dependent dioxygenase alkB-like 6-like [Melia azedarach]|uniref:Alpha-ketoglutarate-dependent dioxygenase alkB-like 6-like n=2 Tax=Melia azedarach TaxID=155640 RepID=A0ACC1YE67_MELAZ|nr:alpha-ketoglutarate-dependent dioxygenase alkB-like 6-like [Melia azedarach]KAJ4721832.1 alpha-ketoglutarate-dependent dioxygenase alkB-like 6-like [Melia azedarach]